ncbi:MAG TPA: DUF4445 domain-containing protein [Candidatus Latescibacteria bacterium]|nr:DUF4445 domain-containing protein [Candidatus Latescibacterota bacterium]
MRKFEVVFQPDGVVAQIGPGTTILDAALSVGIHIEGPCGGKGTCHKCKVTVKGGVSEPSSMETQHLSRQEIDVGYRLACQAEVTGDAIVHVPLATRLTAQKILDHGVRIDVPPTANVKKYPLKLTRPSLEDQRSDFERIRDTMSEGGVSTVSLDVLRRIPGLLRGNDFHITAVVLGDELVDVERGDTSNANYGIAFDIGTTTLVGYLVDLVTGTQTGVSATMNPQSAYGDDVISRISFVTEHKDGLERLHSKVIDAINGMIDDLCQQGEIDPNNIYEVTVAGNTCMHHLFLGIDPRNIGPSPFVPVVSEPMCVQAKELGLQINPRGRVYTLPNVAGYVGADIVGGILATRLWESNRIKLLIDIGTNGELVLGSRDGLIACSTAAGPAFEGARISCGMRAAPGAIDRVALDGDVVYTTVGDIKPRGICGSGLLDIAAEMLRTGVLDPTGRMMDETSLKDLSGPIRERIDRSEDGLRFLLVKGEETEQGHPVYITQKDIRELQLAKGAIFTGIQLLKKELALDDDDLSEVLLAGAFGNYLNKHSALKVGLLPPVGADRVRSVGNAAGEGARMALISTEERKKAEEIAKRVQYIELSGRKDFMENFAENMLFPVS